MKNVEDVDRKKDEEFERNISVNQTVCPAVRIQSMASSSSPKLSGSPEKPGPERPPVPAIRALPAQTQNPPASGNGTQPMTPISNPDDLALLAKLEEANRALELDQKSLQSLSVNSKHSSRSGHSRQGSVSSMMSNTSISSNTSNLPEDDPSNPDDLWARWGKIVGDWENISKKKPNYIKELVRKGVPHHFRGIVWQLLCTAHDSPAKEQYAEFLKMTSPCEKVIRRDITRTYPEHDFFKEKDGLGQESLFNVMKAYSLHDREVGYCQGSGFIVGLVLMQMPEEEAFAVLVRIMQDYRLRELFKPSMAELGLCMFQLECMIQENLPHLYSHFQAQNFSVSMFASSWFLTLFATTLPLSIACRIFDIFLSEGMEMIFRIGFAILQLSLDDLLANDMEGMIKFLQKEMPKRIENDPDTLFHTAFQVKYNAKRMKKLEKEYNALKSKEQEEQVELRRLRTENRLLRQRIENLEKETATLADRLIQDQVKYAQQEEEVYVLRREVSVARQHSHEASQKLGEVTAEYQRLQTQKSNGSAGGLSNNGTVAENGECSKDEKILELQRELSSVIRKSSEDHDLIRELRDKNRELENVNRQVQNEPSAEIQSLQEELVACKLREAEANLSLKELQQKVHDLNRHWQKHLERQNNPSNTKSAKTKVEILQEDLIAIRMREATVIAELKEMKQRVMELETQNHICERQIKRIDTENDRLRETLEQDVAKIKELNNTIKDMERQTTDLESKKKEENMMARIKDAEHSQAIAEMRQRIAELEIENQELVTAGQLQVKGDKEDLENRITELQDEVLQLKMARRLQSLSSLALNNINVDTESDYDTDDMEHTLSSNHLKLTDSMMGLAPQRPMTNDVDSSDGEVLDPMELAKRKHSKKKRKPSTNSKKDHKEIDFDKTPTQELFNSDAFTLGNGVDIDHAETECSADRSTLGSADGVEAVANNGAGEPAPSEDSNHPAKVNGSETSAIEAEPVETN